MTNNELDYQGARVRLKGDMLSLTDMWRAAGSPVGKPPAEWQRHSYAAEFVEYIADTMGKSHSLLIFTKEGRGGGTWGHWQIGMAYAKHLSPALHAWCNSIVRAHMEQRAQGGFQHQVIERLDRIDHRLETVNERVDRLEKRLPKKRREITPATRERLSNATLALGGRCPCCSINDVVSTDGDVLDAEFDHFYSNQEASEEHSWLICTPCHGDLTTGKLPRTEADVYFKSFQLRRARMTAEDAVGFE